MYQIKINSTTGSELITNTDVKLFARIDTTADDDLLDEMITTARQNAENFINSDIVAKNRTYYAAELHQRIELPFSPVASISSVTVFASDIVSIPFEALVIVQVKVAVRVLESIVGRSCALALKPVRFFAEPSSCTVSCNEKSLP